MAIEDMNVSDQIVSTSCTSAKLKKSRGHILIVEDESVVAIDDELTLEGAGFNTIGVVATAEQAIAVAERERPDLVLMDVHLAGPMTGIEAAVQIFERYSIRTIFATAHVDSKTRASADRAKPVGWLIKPFNSFDLVNAVEQALARSRVLGNRRPHG